MVEQLVRGYFTLPNATQKKILVVNQALKNKLGDIESFSFKGVFRDKKINNENLSGILFSSFADSKNINSLKKYFFENLVIKGSDFIYDISSSNDGKEISNLPKIGIGKKTYACCKAQITDLFDLEDYYDGLYFFEKISGYRKKNSKYVILEFLNDLRIIVRPLDNFSGFKYSEATRLQNLKKLK